MIDRSYSLMEVDCLLASDEEGNVFIQGMKPRFWRYGMKACMKPLSETKV